jgi:signal peptidase
MSRTRRTLAYFVQVTVVGAAVALSAVLVVPKLMGWQGVIVLTGSMEPALRTGGVAFVDHVPPERIGTGDLLTFTRPGSRQQVTHRVIEVLASSEGPSFRTKGDANDDADGWTVTPGQVVGKVRFALPYLGGVAQTLVTNRSAIGIAMGIPALFLVADDIRRWRKRRRVVSLPVPVLVPLPEYRIRRRRLTPVYVETSAHR